MKTWVTFTWWVSWVQKICCRNLFSHTQPSSENMFGIVHSSAVFCFYRWDSPGYPVEMSNDVTRILTAIEQGDRQAADQLLPLVYQELRKLAAQKLSRDKAGQSIQPTMLVHDAYVRLVDVEEPQEWNSRGHFFGAAAESMRRILVEHARQKKTQKRQVTYLPVDPNQIADPQQSQQLDLIALDEALTKLAERWPEKCKLVELRYFAGLTVAEAAEILGISIATAERNWRFARTWLHSRLK